MEDFNQSNFDLKGFQKQPKKFLPVCACHLIFEGENKNWKWNSRIVCQRLERTPSSIDTDPALLRETARLLLLLLLLCPTCNLDRSSFMSYAQQFCLPILPPIVALTARKSNFLSSQVQTFFSKVVSGSIHIFRLICCKSYVVWVGLNRGDENLVCKENERTSSSLTHARWDRKEEEEEENQSPPRDTIALCPRKL